MPLITLCGFPCVGKTTFALQLASHIEKSKDFREKCIIINEENLHITKPDHYGSAAQEKILRQNLKSAVEHALNSETFVILDSCNYIKGYRYELYCIARSQRTPHCVVHVSAANSTSDQWNDENSDSLSHYHNTL
jgi:protein KTI12